jgi:ABC-type polysaccharide/polyol phosphate transport system ATPase subunit
MSKPAIIVDRISKKYRLGQNRSSHRSFRDAAVGMLTKPMKRLRSGAEPADGTDFWALNDVEFEVQPGEVVGIIGRNGAGKSTLLKILSRITEPTSGRIRLRGRVASLLEVGTGFHPELTGRENIYLNGAILGMKREEIRRKFDEIVAFAEVEKFLDTPVKFYSSGMYVRLAFAVAAHLEPEILIVDEVLAVGDMEFQKKCLGKMKDVASSEGRTILFVSHNLTAVQSLCRTGVVMRQGRVLYRGPAEDAVAQFLGVARSQSAKFHPCEAGDLKIESAEVVGEAGEIRTLDDAVIQMVVIPKNDITSLGLRIHIETFDGLPLVDLEPYPAHPRCPLRANQKFSVDVHLRRLPLRPGRYMVRLTVRDDGRYVQWEVEQTLMFEVAASLDQMLNNQLPPVMGPVAVEFGIAAKPMNSAN